MRKIMMTVAMAVIATVAMGKQLKTIVLTTQPQMHCENCEQRIKGHLKFEKGIKKIETNVEQQTVTITYDADKTTEANIIKAFSKIDYEATRCEAPEKKEGEK